jgi:hypothetical protein
MHGLTLNSIVDFSVEPQWPLSASDPAVIVRTSPDGTAMRETWTTVDGLNQRLLTLLVEKTRVVLARNGGPPEYLYKGDITVA